MDSIGILHFQQLTCPIVRKPSSARNNKSETNKSKYEPNCLKSTKSSTSYKLNNFIRSTRSIIFLQSILLLISSVDSTPDYKVVEKHLLKVLGIKKRGASKENTVSNYLHRIYTGEHNLDEELMKSVNTARQFGKFSEIKLD